MKFVRNLLLVLLALVVLGGIILAVLYFASDKETKELTYNIRKNTNGSYAELSQGITHYELDGPDSGKVVVLLHGFSVPYYIWNGTYEYLTEHGYRVLRYDMYGRGYSDRPAVTYNQELYFNQLKELISKLQLKTPFSIAGISFGGKLAIDFTNANPEIVDKVILIDPAYADLKPSAPAFITNLMEAINPDKRAFGQTEDLKYPDRHPNWVEEYTPQMEYKGFRHSLVSTMYNYPFNSRAVNISLNTKNKQVLLIWGKDDKTVPFTYSDSIRSVLKTIFLPVDDAAHLPFLEQPDIVNPAIVTFLKK
ncbi:alpha/beta hydrolase [Mucilaginibacter terrenus]|uniref:Alpha/beta hydrolase n=1 Tax=Mucilaginibacter terrenus TaxID=2482727 RepID=A0A3E2NWV2_9SPHI|nr:alpha/beta hydrolase [Mucilaginibacter terrenus]RFZ85483.1 alpha/beta hydrolase [Mucilaginibacter terrenus]